MSAFSIFKHYPYFSECIEAGSLAYEGAVAEVFQSIPTLRTTRPLTKSGGLRCLPEVREMGSLLRRSSNNLNQLTWRVHETGRFYDADLQDIRTSFDEIYETASEILTLAAIR